MSSYIELQNVSKRYQIDGRQQFVPILKNISLGVKKGSFTIIFGPSGSGKSTLLTQMIGLETPETGSIKINGVDIVKLTVAQKCTFRRANVGMVYQSWYWVKSLSVLDNVAMPLYISGHGLIGAREKAYESLKNIKMEGLADKLPTQLSGGEQQRVGLARAIITDPPLIVADEPTGNLDTHTADEVMNFFQIIQKKQGKTVVMVTHNLAYLPMADHTIRIQDGEVLSLDEGVLK